MEQFFQIEILIIELLLVVTLVAILVRRLRIPYTVGLVVAGLLISLEKPFEVNLTPELILAIFVPPLVFEAAFHLSYNDLRRNMVSILLLAVPGVILTTVIVGGVVSLGAAIALPVALIFGALISATDPIAVVATFRALGVPKRLRVLVEGESLFNDGTAIVVFNIVLVVALTGQFSLVEGITDFIIVAAGGIIVGLGLGWIVSRLISRLDDYLIETTLTTVLAFGSYLVAEQLHFSGVLAVVAAGLVNGNISPQGMSPTTRIVIFNFWEYVAFVANSLIFLLIGLNVNIGSLLQSWGPILWAILGILLARVVVVYGVGWLVNRFVTPFPLSWQHVLGWGGLRGAISLALALSLTSQIGPERDLLLLMTFGVVLFTLLVQGTTMRPLLHKLKLVTRSESQIEYETRHARLTALRAAGRHLDNLHRQGLVSSHTLEQIQPALETGMSEMAKEVRKVMRAVPELEAEELDTTCRELLRAQRSALFGLRHDGVVSDEVFERLSAEIDTALSQQELTSPIAIDVSPEGDSVD